MNMNIFKTASVLFFVTCIISCNNSATTDSASNDSAKSDTSKMNTTTGSEVSLFDGKTLNGWHGYNKTGEVKNWTIEDGSLVCLGAAEGDTGGDLVSDKVFENFELTWDWKITKGGNSGVMYHVVENAKYKAPWETGPEYQMMDDNGWPDKLEDFQTTGADYAMMAANDKKKVKAVGEWNTSKILFNKGHVEHWLNGEKILEFQSGNHEWSNKKAAGKWKDYPDYGVAGNGRIALQDHGHKAYFKNIVIKEL